MMPRSPNWDLDLRLKLDKSGKAGNVGTQFPTLLQKKIEHLGT